MFSSEVSLFQLKPPHTFHWHIHMQIASDRVRVKQIEQHTDTERHVKGHNSEKPERILIKMDMV